MQPEKKISIFSFFTATEAELKKTFLKMCSQLIAGW
jgi:hypothetical protein